MLWGEQTEAQTEGSVVAQEEVVGASTQQAGSRGIQHTLGGEPGLDAVLDTQVNKAGIRVLGWPGRCRYHFCRLEWLREGQVWGGEVLCLP